jgi:hypothetical protein
MEKGIDEPERRGQLPGTHTQFSEPVCNPAAARSPVYQCRVRARAPLRQAIQRRWADGVRMGYVCRSCSD